MLTYIEKDILTVDQGCILHQVNCKGVMGAGLALQIARKWPRVLYDYQAICQAYKKNPKSLLGCVTNTFLGGGLYVYNLFGQVGYNGVNWTQQTDYEAVTKALKVFFLVPPLPARPICVPWKMGCGLAGGDWNIVEKLLEPYDITICRWPPSNK